ncbi:MAG: pirin family protein [Thermoplasmatota archaeon]
MAISAIPSSKPVAQAAVEVITPETVPVGAGVLQRDVILPPDATRWDPFILLGRDRFEQGAFDWHPHAGFATFIYVVAGRLRHQDTLGGQGELGPGDAQWMVAGSGVWHDENPVAGEVDGVQLWFNLPAAHKGEAPFHQDLRRPEMPVWTTEGIEATVYAGRLGDATGPARLFSKALLAHLDVSGAGRLPIPAGMVACLLVLKGQVTIGGQVVPAGSAGWIPAASPAAEVDLEGEASVLLVAGEPHAEPVALGMPFVMNTDDELAAAFADLKAGRLGRPPVGVPSGAPTGT